VKTIRALFILYIFGFLMAACTGQSTPPPVTPSPASQAEKDYATWFEDSNSKLESAIVLYNESMAELVVNRNDTDALLHLSLAVMNFNTYHDESLAETAPPSLQEVHQSYVNALQKYGKIYDVLVEGDTSVTVTDMFEQGGQAVLQANNLYRAWRETRLPF
jgi:hypothetical protein